MKTTEWEAAFGSRKREREQWHEQQKEREKRRGREAEGVPGAGGAQEHSVFGGRLKTKELDFVRVL